MEQFDFDVVIVGGGPAGCTCALYTARSELKTVILDKNPGAGALAITHKIANYPGILGEMSGDRLLDLMREQAVEFGTVYKRAQVYGIDISGDIKKVYTPDGVYSGRALVLATGAMGRIASIPGEAEYLGRGVSYCATCDGAFYRNQDVVVVGLNHEAVEEALVLTKFASTVHWITPRTPRPSDGHAEELLSHPSVKLWNKTRLLKIKGEEAGVTGVEICHSGEKECQVLPTLGVFVYLQGSKPITDFVGGQVEFKADGGVLVDEFMQTSVPGVWAVGDIRNTPFKQAVVAAGDGCIAAMAIDRFLNSRKAIKPDWAK